MGGLKLYGALAIASIGLIVAAVSLPATKWIFNTAFWVGRSGPVDYGSSDEADLLEARDLPNYYPIPAQSEYINRRNVEVTRQALALNTPGALSVAMRAVGQGTTLGSTRRPYLETKIKLARLQLQLSQAGMALEKDNSYWPVMASAAHRILGNQKEEDRLFRIASECSVFDDHALYEAKLRAELLESVRGKLGSQQEVRAFSSILLPHFATIKGLCRTRTKNIPLEKSAERRAEVARFSLTLAKTSDNYIGLLVGVATSVASYTMRDTDSEAQTGISQKDIPAFTSEEIKAKASPAQADALLKAMELQELKRRFEDRVMNAEDDWRNVEDSRPQQSVLTLAAGMLLTVPLVWLSRRMASWRESDRAARSFAFLSPLIFVFVAAASGAHMKMEGMVWVMGLGGLAPLFLAGVSIPLDSKWGERILLGINAAAFLGFGIWAINLPMLAVASVFAAFLPILLRHPKTSSEPLLALYSWLGWLVWTGALLHVATTFYMDFGVGFGNSSFEPAIGRLGAISFCALFGGIGAAAMTPPGAKGFWRQASAVQFVIMGAFLVALAHNISRDKTMAKFIPNELSVVREYQSEMKLPSRV